MAKLLLDGVLGFMFGVGRDGRVFGLLCLGL